jgi:Terminase RNaseH-like domain
VDPMLCEELLEEAAFISAGSNRFLLEEFCFKEQLNFITDQAKFKAAVCSRRSGKTVACAAHLIHEAITKPGRIALYITLSRLNAKRIIWNELLAINSRFELQGEVNETELSIRFPNLSIIYLSGAKDKSEIEKFRGLAISLCYIDECQSFRAYIKDLIDDVIGPALMDYAGSLALIGTPGPVPSGYFYECAVSGSAWSKHGWTFWQNPHIARKSGEPHESILSRELTRRGVEITDPSIQREWFGKWVIDADALVFKYDPHRNHFESAPDHKKWQMVIGVDIGFDDADAIAVLGWNEHHRESYLLEEIISNKQTVTDLAEAIGKLIAKYNPLRVVMDTGGLGKKIAEEIRKRYSIPIQAAEKSRKFEYIELVNDALRTGHLFAKKDSRFAQDCMILEWDQDKTTPDRKVVSDTYHSDICDAVLYAYREALHWLSQPEKEKVDLRDKAKLIKHTQKLMDDSLERQIERQTQEQKEADFFNTTGLEEGEIMSYYLNRRRA